MGSSYTNINHISRALIKQPTNWAAANKNTVNTRQIFGNIIPLPQLHPPNTPCIMLQFFAFICDTEQTRKRKSNKNNERETRVIFISFAFLWAQKLWKWNFVIHINKTSRTTTTTAANNNNAGNKIKWNINSCINNFNSDFFMSLSLSLYRSHSQWVCL